MNFIVVIELGVNSSKFNILRLIAIAGMFFIVPNYSGQEILVVDRKSEGISSKGCVRYIFTSLVLGLNESTCQIKKKCFLFHFKTNRSCA